MNWMHHVVGSLFTVIRVELRERPVRFLATVVLILATGLLMPFAEPHRDIGAISQNETLIANITAADNHVHCVQDEALLHRSVYTAKSFPDVGACSRDENKSADSHLARLRPR
jgi:hypothetical protein